MKKLLTRIKNVFSGNWGASNVEIVVWISVVLVVTVSLFCLRDNIYQFITGVSAQIAGETDDGLNEYGFYYERQYYTPEYDLCFTFHEDGSATLMWNGEVLSEMSPGDYSYSNGRATLYTGAEDYFFSDDGKSAVCYDQYGRVHATFTMK